MLFFASFFFSSSAGIVVVGGIVFGMSRKVVMPPFAAAIEPVRKSSLCVNPGSLMWTWTSISPGNTRLFFTSIILSALGSLLVIFDILPFFIRIFLEYTFSFTTILQFLSNIGILVMNAVIFF